MLESIKIHEVGLRDGLQNESVIVPTEKKIQWIETMLKTGIDIIQLGSFVHPVKMPQMADTAQLFEHFANIGHSAVLSCLVLNQKGLERGLKCGAEMFCMGVSASRTHSLKNTGMTNEEAMKITLEMAKEAESAGKRVQLSVQSAFGCGYEGKIQEDEVILMVNTYLDAGFLNISLADTAGHAYPEQVKRLFSAIKRIDEHTVLTAHFHNTYGLGLANCYAAMYEGAEYFETAFGGLGGCPFTKTAAGNIATEDFVHSIHRNHTRLDISLNEIFEVAIDASEYLNKPMQSYVLKTGAVSY